MQSHSTSGLMESAVKHYSALFKLPPYSRMVILLALLCIVGGILSGTVLYSFPESLTLGVPLGCALLLVTLLSDYVTSKILLRCDAIYDIRRTAGLSIFSWILWTFFIFFGVILSVFIGKHWGVKVCLLGFSAVIILRSTVLLSTSFANTVRVFAAAMFTPTLCYFTLLATWTTAGFPAFFSVIFLAPAILIGAASSSLLIRLVNQVGFRIIGVSGITIFKAFLLNWVANINRPFEEILETLGESRDVEVSLIQFRYEQPNAMIVVPSVHPGPFKNIGSSLLPFLIKSSLEKRFRCVVCVPHGLFGHEFDLTSQLQNEKLIKYIIENVKLDFSDRKASPFVKVQDGHATACCQIFGNTALVSFTLAPTTTEDLPEELGLFLRKEAEKLGLTHCIIVNAHNSIDGNTNMDDALVSLKKLGASCLEKAVSLERLPLEVGTATVYPKEFSLSDGMGQGGVTVVVVKVGQQKTAYVVIDGNNMVSGLREKILSALDSSGVNAGEVFTTDTHSVNATVLGERGYHPIGQVISHEKLIKYIETLTTTALNNSKSVSAVCNVVTVPGVKVIGEALLKKLCLLIDEALKKAKASALPIFSLSGLFILLVLALA